MRENHFTIGHEYLRCDYLEITNALTLAQHMALVLPPFPCHCTTVIGLSQFYLKAIRLAIDKPDPKRMELVITQ